MNRSLDHTKRGLPECSKPSKKRRYRQKSDSDLPLSAYVSRGWDGSLYNLLRREAEQAGESEGFVDWESAPNFQVSGSPSGACPIRKGNFPSHRSLKRKRGVGEHPESSRLSCLPRLRPLGPPIFAAPQPLARASGFLNVRINWATWRCEFQIKFQLSSATGCAGSYRKETMGSLSYDPR